MARKQRRKKRQRQLLLNGRISLGRIVRSSSGQDSSLVFVTDFSMCFDLVVDPGMDVPVPLSGSKPAEASMSGKSDVKTKAREAKPQEVRVCET